MKLAGKTEAQALSQDLLRNSLLYRELTAEHEEILKHKWIESEKAGRDIGFDVAMIDWTLRHRSQWHRWRREHCLFPGSGV